MSSINGPGLHISADVQRITATRGDHTPPSTPPAPSDTSKTSATAHIRSRSSSSVISSLDEEVRADIASGCLNSKKPLEFPVDVELDYDQAGLESELGRGVWSIVSKAVARQRTSTFPMTPPSSPATRSRVFAVKAPLRRDAHAILHAEALALTLISLTPGAERYIVPFHGFITASSSVVMSAVPHTLSTHIEEKAILARTEQSTRTMFDPVLGMLQWKDLAGKLITGLYWLHDQALFVHGDAKPHNILLQPCFSGSGSGCDEFPFRPLFADFSSTHDVSFPSRLPTHTKTAAFTPPFTAPELLSLPSISAGDAPPTPASDVFSLAVTLLAAATGDLLLYPGTNKMQRLAMAREGHRIIEFVRSGDNGCRVPRDGIVENVINPAIVKDADARIMPAAWLELVEALA